MVRRILLIKPPEQARLNFGAFSLGVLAAAVRDLADVTILDATTLSLREAARAVRRNRPELIGVTVMGMTSVAPAVAFIRALRAEYGLPNGDGHPLILAGGHGASMLPEALLTAGADAVVMGEGETTFRRIVQEGIQPGTPGLACRIEGRLLIGLPQTPIVPLDRLNAPAREFMPPPRDGVHLMETSRGCPHSCAFCETTRFYGRRWRPFTPERVAEEVRRLVDDYDAWMIHFADDNFAAGHQRVLDICELLRRGPLPACIVASARADDLLADARLIPALAAANINRITVGVESPNPELAAAVGKPIAPDTYRQAFQRLREHGIFSVASFIVGLPGETLEMRKRMVAAAIAIGPDSARFVPFHPQPGTPLACDTETFLPSPIDERDAQLFTRAFYQASSVRIPLEQAVAAGGIRGILAGAVLRAEENTNLP